MILIGSRALALRAPVALSRQPKDFDLVGTSDEVHAFVGRYPASVPHTDRAFKVDDTMVEFSLLSDRKSNELLTELVDAEHTVSPFGRVPALDLLFTLKSSHRYLKNSPHFWKNLADWHRLRGLGAKVRPEYAAFLKLREQETYNYRHPKLNTSKASFFSEEHGVKYQYDHDSIHAAVARLDRPAYRFFQKDGEEVACDKRKFFACAREVQLLSVVEESCVLAIERSLVPHPNGMTPKKAWLFALSKVCTSIASGWWRQFAYENALDVLRMYPEDYYQRFLAGVKSCIVKEA